MFIWVLKKQISKFHTRNLLILLIEKQKREIFNWEFWKDEYSKFVDKDNYEIILTNRQHQLYVLIGCLKDLLIKKQKMAYKYARYEIWKYLSSIDKTNVNKKDEIISYLYHNKLIVEKGGDDDEILFN